MSVQMSHNESKTRWYYCINGREFGPFSSEMINDWIRDGWLRDDLQMRTENDNRYCTLEQYKTTWGSYPFNLSEPLSINARVGLGGYEFGFNQQQQLASTHEAAAMGAQQQYHPPPLLARPLNLVSNAGFGHFPPPVIQVAQQPRNAVIPIFRKAAPPVHVSVKTRTEPIQIPASRAEAVLSQLLQIPVKILPAMPPSSSSTSAGDEKRRGGAD